MELNIVELNQKLRAYKDSLALYQRLLGEESAILAERDAFMVKLNEAGFKSREELVAAMDKLVLEIKAIEQELDKPNV